MIELVVQRRKSRLHIGEIHDPTKLGIGFARNVDLDFERVAVQARALMPFGHIRQAVSCLEVEDFEDMHLYILALSTALIRCRARRRCQQHPTTEA